MRAGGDNFTVGLNRGRIIEEDHYYAFGLKIAAISSVKLGDVNEGVLKNNYLYEGSFSEFDDDVNLNDFELRNYDSQIGRFIQQDPYNQFPFPYTGIANDPINTYDPNGGLGINFGELGKVTGSVLGDRLLVAGAGALFGYGIDRLSGGNGWKGAAIGGVAGFGITFIPPFDIGNILKESGKSALIQTADITADVMIKHLPAEVVKSTPPNLTPPSAPTSLPSNRSPSLSIPAPPLIQIMDQLFRQEFQTVD